jgi:hypothetical protein
LLDVLAAELSVRPNITALGAKEIREITSALLLQRNAYERIANDPTGTLRASAVVVFVALVHGASALLRVRAFGWSQFSAPLYGLLGEIAFWAGAGLGSAALSRWCFDVSAPLRAYYRALGLAAVPGILIAVPAAASVFAPGMERIGLPLVALYRAAALFVALRSAGSLSWTQGAIASFAALLSGFTAVAAITVPLNAGLPG